MIWHIGGMRVGLGVDFDCPTCARLACGCEFPQRCRLVRAATDSLKLVAGRCLGDLFLDQLIEVIDVQNVANLMSLPAEAHIGKAFSPEMTCGPEGDEALVHFSHLPWACDHSTAIHDRSKSVDLSVLFDQQFRAELARTIGGPMACEGKVFCDATLRPPRSRRAGRYDQSISGLFEGERTQCWDWMYAARREEHEHGVVTLAALETCRDGLEMGLDEGTDPPAIATSHGWIRSTVDYEVEASDAVDFVQLARIRLDEFDTAPV